MTYTTLGASGLKISGAALGTMNFGLSGGVRGCDEPAAARIVGAFLDAGHNLIDTADGYAGGESEHIVGRAIAHRRDEVVLATKAFLPQAPGPNNRGLSRAHLTRALEASLRRLGTEHIDLYQCHKWDASTPIAETMATLDGFVRSGKVRYLGCSNFTAAQLVEAQWASGSALISLQPEYSLLNRGIEAEILPACARHGLGVLAWSPLGGGVLAGRYRRDRPPPPDTRVARLRELPAPMARAWAGSMISPRYLSIAAQVATVAEGLGRAPADVALAWVRQRPGVTAVIIGPRTPEQLAGNLAALALDLPPAAVAELDAISAPDDGVEGLIRRYFEMWNAGDPTLAADLLGPGWTDHAHPDAGGPAAAARAVERIRAARPDLRFELDSIAGTVAVGTARDGDAEPTRLAWVFGARAGRLTEVRTYRA